MRRTKIVATLGPGSSAPEVIEEMIRAGVDVFRLNFSHGTHQEQAHRNALIRTCSEKAGRTVGVLADLQGHLNEIQRQYIENRIEFLDTEQEHRQLSSAEKREYGELLVQGHAVRQH